MVSENCAACAFHRTSSPPSAEMSALAASIRRCVAAASSSSAWGQGSDRPSAECSALVQLIHSCCLQCSCLTQTNLPPQSKLTCFCAMAASNWACMASRRACTTASSSSTACRSRVATLSSASLSRSLAILGSTT